MSYVQTRWGLRHAASGRWASIDDARVTTFFWVSLGDACPECSSLNGRVWHDQDIFQEVLWDPIWGNILDLTTGQKLTHGNTGINCRCTCAAQVEYDISNMKPIVELGDVLELLI